MRIPRAKLRLTLLVALAACSTSEAPTTPQPGPPSFATNGGVEVSVNGGGIVDFSSAGVGNGYFSFNAVQKADGTVHGRFHQRRERNGLVIDFTGDVTCLTVDATLMRARIGGRITENNSTDPAFLTTNHEVGDDVWFRVQDGGEGSGAVDASTTYGFKPTLVDTSEQYCALPFTGLPWWNPVSIFPLESGNIQIRP